MRFQFPARQTDIAAYRINWLGAHPVKQLGSGKNGQKMILRLFLHRQTRFNVEYVTLKVLLFNLQSLTKHGINDMFKEVLSPYVALMWPYIIWKHKSRALLGHTLISRPHKS